MGVRNFDIEKLRIVNNSQGLTFYNLKMLQLGDQMYREKSIRAKKFFEDIGTLVTSIDINGEGGSLPLDLSKPINNPAYINHFDIVTNFGTSEHVENHIMCFENMYNFTRKNGIMFNLVPREGFWNKGSHSKVHKYTTDFFDDLAKHYSCELLENRYITQEERKGGGLVMSALKKWEKYL